MGRIDLASRAAIVYAFLLAVGVNLPAQAETFVVTTTEDSGPGSLREQIAVANATPEGDVIEFDVAGTIRLTSPLPQITQPLAMDGEGAVEIDGTDLDAGVFALDIQQTSKCVIEGMVIRNFRGNFSGAIRVQGNSFGNVIADNTLVGNLGGIVIAEGPTDAANNRVEGNYIDAEVGLLAPVPGEFRQINGVMTYGIRLHAASGNVLSENWVFRAFHGISIFGYGLEERYGYARGQSNGNEVTRNRTFFTANQGLLVTADASDNTLSENEVHYASRHGIELFGDSGRFGNLGRVANGNVVTGNVFVGTGFNDPNTSAGIVVVGSTHDNVFARNRISGSASHGIAIWEDVRGNVFEENEVDGAEGYGVVFLSGAIFDSPVPGNGPMANNRFERNVISNTLGAVSIQGDAAGNLFRENTFGPQKDSVVIKVDGDQTPEAPDRVAADNRFEQNVYTDVEGRVLWSFTASTMNNRIVEPEVRGQLDLDTQLVTPEGLKNGVFAAQETSLSGEEFERLMSRMMGTWELQVDKSTVTSGLTLRKQTVTYERASDNSISFTSQGIAAEGAEFKDWGTQVFDGKLYQMKGTASNRAARKTPVDEFTIVNRITQDGKPFARSALVFSADGQRLTNIIRDAEDRITFIAVFDKVADAAP